MKYIGQSVPGVDAIEKVRGEAVFASDMAMPGQAYMKMLMAHRPHAIVKSVNISSDTASAIPSAFSPAGGDQRMQDRRSRGKTPGRWRSLQVHNQHCDQQCGDQRSGTV